jgi:cellulose synthase/poly-beta-1,6-N-acetylglucosamine synthase-like glycosyltransferase
VQKSSNASNEKNMNKPLISVIFATYKDAGFIEENYLKLSRSKVKSEFIVAADEPKPHLEFLLKKYSFKVCLSWKRRGKWRALNEATRVAEGKYLLFIDADTKLISSLDDIVKALEDYDAIEIRKEISGNSILEKLVNIDYLNMFAVAKISEKLNSCLGLNGAAFAIKKEVFYALDGFRNVINEDTDLGIRLGLKGYRFGTAGKAETTCPKTIREWILQRERWATGGAQAILNSLTDLAKKPVLWMPALYLIFPAVVAFILNNIVTGDVLTKIVYLILPLVLCLPQKVLFLVLFLLFQERMIKNAIVGIVTFTVWAIVEVFAAKKLEWKISYLLLPAFYFVYSPAWLVLSFVALLRVSMLKLAGKSIKIKNWNP